MNLPRAPIQYDARDQNAVREAVRAADGRTHKRGADIEVGAGSRVVFVDTANGARWALSVAGGVLTLTAA